MEPLGIFEHWESGFAFKWNFVANGIKGGVGPKGVAFFVRFSHGTFVSLVEFRRVRLFRPNASTAGAHHRNA